MLDGVRRSCQNRGVLGLAIIFCVLSRQQRKILSSHHYRDAVIVVVLGELRVPALKGTYRHFLCGYWRFVFAGLRPTSAVSGGESRHLVAVSCELECSELQLFGSDYESIARDARRPTCDVARPLCSNFMTATVESSRLERLAILNCHPNAVFLYFSYLPLFVVGALDFSSSLNALRVRPHGIQAATHIAACCFITGWAMLSSYSCPKVPSWG